MKYYTVVDTNVLVSALLKENSIPGQLFSWISEGRLIPVYSDQITQEYREVLRRPKFHFPPSKIKMILDTIEKKGIEITAETLEVVLPDPKDRVFYEVVMEERKVRDAWLITGNLRHFPTKFFIVTPRQMMEIVNSTSLNSGVTPM